MQANIESQNGDGRSADGVVCFAGVDWWYHNHGHSECQIMTRLARRIAVLWINPIGMRMPVPGKTDIAWTRYIRKVRSTLQGLRRDPTSGMWVYSPLFVPRYTPKWLEINGMLLSNQVRALCWWLHIRRPAAFVSIPTTVAAVERGKWARKVFNRCDEFSAFPQANQGVIVSLEQRLVEQCDTVLYVNRSLMHRESSQCRHCEFIGHGVDFANFARAIEQRGTNDVAELKGLQRPIIGFFGALDDYRIDDKLLVDIARRFRDATILLIGPKQMDLERVLAESNVCYVGPVPYERLPLYAAQIDVGIIPYKMDSSFVESCNPIKLKEYLASGFPVVTTDFPALEPYRELCHVARTPDQFLAGIQAALDEAGREDLALRRRLSVKDDSWENLADRVACSLGVENGQHVLAVQS